MRLNKARAGLEFFASDCMVFQIVFKKNNTHLWNCNDDWLVPALIVSSGSKAPSVAEAKSYLCSPHLLEAAFLPRAMRCAEQLRGAEFV